MYMGLCCLCFLLFKLSQVYYYLSTTPRHHIFHLSRCITYRLMCFMPLLLDFCMLWARFYASILYISTFLDLFTIRSISYCRHRFYTCMRLVYWYYCCHSLWVFLGIVCAGVRWVIGVFKFLLTYSQYYRSHYHFYYLNWFTRHRY